MKKRILAVLAASTLSFSAKAQCHLPLNGSLDATLDVLWEQYLERGDPHHIDGYRRKYEQNKQAATLPQADSLFRRARADMIHQLGEEIFCRRVDMNLWSAFKFYGRTQQVLFRFHFDEIGKGQEPGYQAYRYNYDTRAAGLDSLEYPDVPDCRNRPELCDFEVVSGKQAEQIAEEEGFFRDSRYHQIRQNGWFWEIEKLTGDDCQAQKVKIDIYTGQLHYFDSHTWPGCIPFREKVEKSPLVIEGTVLEEEGGFFHNGIIWSRRLLEVNRLFKGQVKAGVIEVVAFGGQLGGLLQFSSHGQNPLPGKGQTAIFFLSQPKPESAPMNVYGIDSLTPYPVYLSSAYYPMVLYPSPRDKTSFTLDIEHHTYQAIEAAAGQSRQNFLLPAHDNEAFVNWAVEKGLPIPNRQLGLEYRLMPQNREGVDDTLSFHIGINAPASHSYLQHSVIALAYNPRVFGDSVVSKKRAHLSLLHQDHPSVRGTSLSRLLVPDRWRFQAWDLADSLMLIHISSPEQDSSIFQLAPFNPNPYSSMQALPLLEVRLPVLNREANMGIRFAEKQMEDGNARYDIERGKTVPYAYAWAHGEIDIPADEFQVPEITAIFPDALDFRTDTLIIRGKHLSGPNAEVLIPCEYQGRKRHLPIPETLVLHQADAEIRCRVPDVIVLPHQSGDNASSWKPVSGPVKVAIDIEGLKLEGEGPELKLMY